MESNNLLEKYFPQLCVKAIVTGVGNPFQDIIFLGDREIYLSVSEGVLYAKSRISLPNGEDSWFGFARKPLIPNYSPRMALENARNSIFKQMESYVQGLQNNPFVKNPDVKLNREILDGTHNNNLGNFLANFVTNGEIKVAG